METTMAPRDNLLKEAIADAKMVRDAAIANARIQIEEAFAPHMDSLLSQKLRNAINEGENPGTSGIAGSGVTVDEPAPKEPTSDAWGSSHIKNKPQEVEPMGEGVEDPTELDAAGGPEAGVGGAPHAASPAVPAPQPPVVPVNPAAAPVADPALGGGQIPGDTQDDVLDLEAIIRELELDVADDAGMGAPAAPGAPAPAPAPAVAKEGFNDPMAGKKVDGPITVQKESTNGANDKDGPGAPQVDGVNGGKKVSPGQKVNQWEGDHESVETVEKDHGAISEELSLDEILREMEAEDGEPVNESYDKIASENAELKRSLRQHVEVIQFIKGKLHEVNMLNSKLLYTNRLFKSFDLNVDQKKKVVETFDRAQTVREVKLVYTTLAESFNGRSASGSKKSGAKGIVEGMASKPMGSTKPSSAAGVSATTKPQVLAEGNDMVARMQKLAGIKLSS
jgi:hypothetical protein